MITVCLNEANFEYDIHSLVKAFYPGEDVKVFADREKIYKLEEQCAPIFRLEIFYCRETEACTDAIEIFLKEEKTRGSEQGRQPLAMECEEQGKQLLAEISSQDRKGTKAKAQAKIQADFSDRGDTKNRLKRCLYRMLSEYSGRTLPWGTLTGIRPTKIAMSRLENGQSEADICAFMAEAYLASEEKINLSIEIARREMELLHNIDYQDGYSLYVGIPFCPSICSYCSFSSSPIGLWEERTDDYLDALEKEIDFTSQAFRRKKLNAVYIGGGTPTTLSPRQLHRLLAKIAASFDFSHLLEYTVEAGRPDSITKDKLEVLREHDVSRISINPQTMKQETLDVIGRRHTVEQTIESFHLARDLGFDNINMDLIVGLPGETVDDVRNTMKMFPENYQGMKMENTWEIIALTAAYARKMELLPYYLYRQKNMTGNFENVGYASPGKAGLYNILIMEEVQSIVALGAGSISKRVEQGRKIERCENVKDVAQYIARIDEMIERKRILLE